MSALRASVIIPTYNGVSYLRDCLASLVPQCPSDVELIVVDNGSTDGTTAEVRRVHPEATVIEAGQNLGFCGGNNLGARAARGEWLVFLNNDTVADPQWLERLLAAAAGDPAYGAWTSKIRLLHDRGRLDAIGSYLTPTGFLQHVGLLDEDHGQYDALKEIFSPKGVAFAIRRSLFEAIGGFDESYFAYFEETDLFWQVWLRGFRIGLAPDAVVYHKVGGTACRYPYAFVDYHSFKNRILTIGKNAGSVTLIWMLPFHLVCCGVLIVLNGLRIRRWSNAWAIVRAMGWNLLHLRQTWRQRGMVQRARRVTDHILFKTIMRPVAPRDFLRYTLWMVWSREAMRAKGHGMASMATP